MILVLARKTNVYNRKRSGSEQFAENEIFIKAESVGLIIIGEEMMGKSILPSVFIQRSVLGRSYSVFPLITGCKISTLDNTSAREAEDTRLKVGKSFDKIGTQPVDIIAGEKRYMLKIDSILRFLEENAQLSL